MAPFFLVPLYGEGDVIVAAGNLKRKGVVNTGNELYASIGYIVIWCVKYILIPIGVGVTAKVIAAKLITPQPGRQRKKR